MGRKRSSKATTLTERVELKMSALEKRTFQEAALRHGISLSHWLRLAAWRIIDEQKGDVKFRPLDA